MTNPQPTPAPTIQQPPAPALFPEAPAARKPSRFEKAIADARAIVDYEPEWFWRIHRITAANQLGPAVTTARQDGLDYDPAAAEESIRGAGLFGTFQAILAHEGRETPIFRRPPFTIEAPPAAPAPAASSPAAGFRVTADQIPGLITAGVALIAGLRDLFKPTDALTVKDLLPLMQKQQERTPVAEIIEGIEAIRRISPAGEAAESGGGEIGEIIRAAAPAVLAHFAQAQPRPQPRPAPRIQQQRPALAPPQPTPSHPTPGPAAAQSGAAAQANPGARLIEDFDAGPAAMPGPAVVPAIAQAIGFGAQHDIAPESIAPAIFDLIRGPDENATRETAVNIQAAGADHYAQEWTAETPALSLCTDYTQAAAEALAELAGDIRADLDEEAEAERIEAEAAAPLVRTGPGGDFTQDYTPATPAAPVAQEAPQGGKEAPAGEAHTTPGGYRFDPAYPTDPAPAPKRRGRTPKAAKAK